MASKKKQAEGIALLSMYNDDEDEEMEDVEENLAAAGQEGEQHGDDRDTRAVEDDLMPETNSMAVSYSAALDTPPLTNDGMTPEKTKFRSSTPQQPSLNAAVSQLERRAVSSDSRRIRRGALTIVDYAHDEVAVSPEPEVLLPCTYVLLKLFLISRPGIFHTNFANGLLNTKDMMN